MNSVDPKLTATTWHTTTRIAENLYRISEPFGAIEPRFGITTANMYLVLGQERAALIDSGTGVGDLRAEITRITSLPCTVLNTHYHWDHVGANSLFDERAIHEREVDLLAQEQDVSWLRPAMQSPGLPPNAGISPIAAISPGLRPGAFGSAQRRRGQTH